MAGGGGMRMPIRVRVASYRRVRKRRWMWTCPACPDTGWGSLSRAAAHRQAYRHATTCPALWEMNEAVVCPSCRLYGRVAPACPVCLGRGWVR